MHVEGLTEAEAAELVATVLSKQRPSTFVNILDDEIIAALFPMGETAAAVGTAATFGVVVTVISTKNNGPWDDNRVASPSGFGFQIQ